MADLVPVVWGLSEFHDCLIVVPTGPGRRLADETDAIKACASFGDLRALAPTLTEARPPVNDETLDDEATDVDEPFDWTDPDPDDPWPPDATSDMLAWVNADLLEALVEQVGAETVNMQPHGDGLEIPANREADLVAVLEAHGYAPVRDDALINRLSAYE